MELAQLPVTKDQTLSIHLAALMGLLAVSTLPFRIDFLDGGFWSFDVVSAWWSTIHISNLQKFGVQGVPSNSTFPGFKYFHACVISSFDNQFYLFGGSDSGTILITLMILITVNENNIWRFNFTLQQWTFLKGNLLLGTSVGLGVESPLNFPTGRWEHTMNAMSSSNSIVVFGGRSDTIGSLNDLWRYNVTSNNWCLLRGNISTSNQPAVYGTAGVASAANIPAGVYHHCAAFLPGTDLLYVFGGYRSAFLNELWIFNCSSAQWTFVSSSATAGVYTNGGQYPGARSGHSFATVPKTSLFVMVLVHQLMTCLLLDEWRRLRKPGISSYIM